MYYNNHLEHFPFNLKNTPTKKPSKMISEGLKKIDKLKLFFDKFLLVNCFIRDYFHNIISFRKRRNIDLSVIDFRIH